MRADTRDHRAGGIVATIVVARSGEYFRRSGRMREPEGDARDGVEARVGIEPAYTALQAAA
jgi:hypothetical protein